VQVILIGPPGSGKGTQAKRLSAQLAIPHVSTGDMLREAIAEVTELGKVAAPIVASGALVPDDLMIGIIKERLGRPDAAGGSILDGFPRTVVQAEKLDALLAQRGGNGAKNVRVVQLLVPDEAIVKRIAARRSCGNCGAIYHLETAPPAKAGVCDRCGAGLIARVDDTETAVRKRLQAFHGQTMPVVSYYRNQNLLREVDGVGPVDEVFERIRKSLS
jgi:adenylate kinase